LKGEIIMPKYTFEAAQFCDAIRELASKPENLQNLENYLEYSFDKWMEKYASTPACITAEMSNFAQMEI
jgi:hypothetical protein